MKQLPVAITIVTHNSEWYIRPCLEAVLALDPPPEEVVVADNASRDGTRSVLREFGAKVRIVHNDRNTGFSAGQNQAIALTSAAWVLTLNPDALLPPEFLARLLDGPAPDARVGALCGRSLSLRPDLSLDDPPRLDSTGIVFTRQLRHLDRGWGEPDDGRYEHPCEVFGASAAAALYRRRMIEDVSVEGQFFDESFFAYREDADVAWRAQLLGWRCLYRPEARLLHVRRLRPGGRRRNPAAVNMHSVKNRFLMRVKNLTWPVWRRCWAAALARDAVVVGGCLLVEQSSLPAFWHLLWALPGALRQRRAIMARLSPEAAGVARWFGEDEPETCRPRAPKKIAPAVVHPGPDGS